MSKITTPGIYSMSNADYHGDPCDSPALGSTGVQIALRRRDPQNATADDDVFPGGTP